MRKLIVSSLSPSTASTVIRSRGPGITHPPDSAALAGLAEQLERARKAG
jgi:hypothetical protein